MQLCGSLSILWHCLSLGLEWKLTFSSPVAIAEFSKCAGILSAALSQHHLLGFETAQREFHHFHSVQFSCSVMSTLCNPMDCSTPGFPVHHQLPEFAQTYFHWIGDAIQPSHPLSSSCPPVFNLSQHQDLFQWVSSAHQVPKYWSFSFSSSPPNEYLGLISYRIDWLNPLAVQEAFFSNTQFKSINSYVLSFLYSPTLTSIHDY